MVRRNNFNYFYDERSVPNNFNNIGYLNAWGPEKFSWTTNEEIIRENLAYY